MLTGLLSFLLLPGRSVVAPPTAGWALSISGQEKFPHTCPQANLLVGIPQLRFLSKHFSFWQVDKNYPEHLTKICYALNIKYPPQAHVLNALFFSWEVWENSEWGASLEDISSCPFLSDMRWRAFSTTGFWHQNVLPECARPGHHKQNPWHQSKYHIKTNAGNTQNASF